MSNLERPTASASLVVDLARIVGVGGVSVAEADRLAYCRDSWPRDTIRARAGELPNLPTCVVWPETPEEVARVLQLAADRDIPVVPYGGGSGVAGGARPSSGGIVLDTKRLRQVRSLDATNLRLVVEAGVIGERLERWLNHRGFTLGHFPSSILCSTVGGWIAARSAGQASTLYGKIEDMTLGLEVATPGRVRRTYGGPRPGRGIDLGGVIIGSEGTLGVVTAAELRVRPLPESRKFWGFQMPSVESGVETIRRMLRVGLRPAVVRLYDSLDTFLGRGHGHEDEEAGEVRSADALAGGVGDLARSMLGAEKQGLRARVAKTAMRGAVQAVLGVPRLLNRAADALPAECLLVLGFEGQPAIVAAEFEVARSIAEGEGAVDLGPGPGEHWLKNRYNVSFKMSKAFNAGAFVDTMEVAATWDRLLPLFRAVRGALGRDALVMAHFSHAYAEGCSIYFTFVGAGTTESPPTASLTRYDRLWRNALAAALEAGGTFSHHHGVGELKASAMAREHGPGALRVLEAIKQGFDPSGTQNPGKLGLAKDPRGAHRSLRPRPRPTAGLPKEVLAAVGERNLITHAGRTVIRPPDENALAAVLRVAGARATPILSDQGGLRAPKGAVEVDLSRLEGVSRLSAHSLFVEAEAGLTVARLEAMLSRHGLTLGRVHPRAQNRSLGAALAKSLLVRRATAFGDLGDLCMAVRGILPNGSFFETKVTPRSATGPELRWMLIGAEGRFGIITRATVRVSLVPAVRAVVGYAFEGGAAAADFLRLVHRRGVRPGAARVTFAGAAAEGQGRAFLELVAQREPLLKAAQAIVQNSAESLHGRPIEPGDEHAGGRFDAVVEVAVPWSGAAALARRLALASDGEVWLDFAAPEGVVVVARVVDRESRLATVRAAREGGGRIVAGARHRESEEGFDDLLDAIGVELDPQGIFARRSSGS